MSFLNLIDFIFGIVLSLQKRSSHILPHLVPYYKHLACVIIDESIFIYY